MQFVFCSYLFRFVGSDCYVENLTILWVEENFNCEPEVHFHWNLRCPNRLKTNPVRFWRRNLRRSCCSNTHRKVRFLTSSDSWICPWTLDTSFRPWPWRSRNKEIRSRCRKTEKITKNFKREESWKTFLTSFYLHVASSPRHASLRCLMQDFKAFLSQDGLSNNI